jgi:hypothetical protein
VKERKSLCGLRLWTKRTTFIVDVNTRKKIFEVEGHFTGIPCLVIMFLIFLFLLFFCFKLYLGTFNILGKIINKFVSHHIILNLKNKYLVSTLIHV